MRLVALEAHSLNPPLANLPLHPHGTNPRVGLKSPAGGEGRKLHWTFQPFLPEGAPSAAPKY